MRKFSSRKVSPSDTVTVDVRKDNALWGGSNKNLQLSSRYKVYSLNDNGTGRYGLTDVASGTYTIIDNGYNTGISVTVNDKFKTVTLDYYTLIYNVTPTNGVAYASIHAYYADDEGRPIPTQLLESGSAALTGANVVFQAEARKLRQLESDTGRTLRFDWQSDALTDLEQAVVVNSTGQALFQMEGRAAKLSCVVDCNYPGNSYNVVVFYLEDKAWADSNLEVYAQSTFNSTDPTLIAAGTVWATYELSDMGLGVYTGILPADTYQIYADGQAIPGLQVTVGGGQTLPVRVDYWKLSYNISLPDTNNTATSAVFRVETGDANNPDAPRMLHGEVVLDANKRTDTGTFYVPYVTQLVSGDLKPRTALILTAQGFGANTYGYAWSHTDAGKDMPTPMAEKYGRGIYPEYRSQFEDSWSVHSQFDIWQQF